MFEFAGINKAFGPNPSASARFQGMTIKQLKDLLIYCTTKAHFYFNGNFYDQKDGVAMGSPLGPLLANAFMCDFEERHKEKLEELGITTWMRYVDDIFAELLESANEEEILNYLNNQHKSIKFTIEHAKNDALPFLDTCVHKHCYNDNYSYNVRLYHKPTFTGVYLNWTSLTHRRYKIQLIYTLLDRIWKITTDLKQREEEMLELKQILIKNDYPIEIIDSEIHKFKKRKQTATQTQPPENNQSINQSIQIINDDQTSTDNSNKTQQTTDNSNKINEKSENKFDNTFFFSLPYVSPKVDNFAKRLQSTVCTQFPNLDFKLAFKSPGDIGKLFPFKHKINHNLSQSLVVYKIQCETCGANYIGKTEQIMSRRMYQHNYVNKTKPNEPPKSAITMHRRDFPDHIIEPQRAEIIDRATDNSKLEMKEWIQIKNRKPTLNVQFNKLDNNGSFNRNLKLIIIDHLV